MNRYSIKDNYLRVYFTENAMVCKDLLTSNTVVFSGKEEFVLYAEEDGVERPYFSSAMTRRFRRISAAEAELCFDGQGFKVSVLYRAEKFRLIKSLSVSDRQQRLLRRITCEGRTSNLPLTRGGEGQPVFVGGCMWCGIEFPAAANRYADRKLQLTQTPFVRLDRPFRSFEVVYAFQRGNSLETSFRRYIEGMCGHEKLKIYCDWGLHDDLSDNVELTEAMTNDNIDRLSVLMEKSGVRFDYYLMDAYWFEENQPYIRFKERTFPGGIDAIIGRLEKLGVRFGLWFDLNCIHAHLRGMEKYDTMLGNGSLCFACDEIAEMMYEAIRYHILNHKVCLVKLDFAYFECKNPQHGHSIDFVESKEKSITNFIRMTERLKELNPELKIICYNGWTTELDWIGSVKEKRGFAVSPYWGRSVDYVYCGDPRPSEIPTRRLEDSIVYYTDAMIRNFYDALMPFSIIDDHGTMIGDTSTIYRLGKALFRCGWLMNAMRGSGKLHLYGKIELLDEEDVVYMRRIAEIFEEISAGDYETGCVLGDPRRGEVYGYSASQGDAGYAVLLNPSSCEAPFALELPEWANSEVTVETIVEDGQLTHGRKKTFVCYTGRLSANGYRLVRWERRFCECKNDRVVLDPHSRLALRSAGMQIALCFEKDGVPLKSTRGFPAGLTVTSGGRVLEGTVHTDIWSGISWLYFTDLGGEEIMLDYEGDDNIVVRYYLQGNENERR